MVLTRNYNNFTKTHMKYLAFLLFLTVTTFAQNNPEKIVQIQLDAYNKQNIEVFASTYADDVEIFEFGSEKPYLVGKENLKKSYADFFKENPTNFAALQGRIIQGNYVIDKERVTSDKYEFFGTAIYLVENNLIKKVWFIH